MKRATIATRIHQQTGIPMEEAVKLLDHILEILKNILQAVNRSHSLALVSLPSAISVLARDGIPKRVKR